MNIGSIGTPVTAQKLSEQKPPPPKPAVVASTVSKASSSIATTTEEAIETSGQTKQEAANGDPQARRILVKQAAAQQLRAPAQNGVGAKINTKA